MYFAYTRARRLGACIALAITCLGGGALAQTRSDFETCQSSTDVPQMIAACTAIVDATRLPEQIRSMALLKRGFGNFALGKLDAARADYSAAIELDTSNHYAHHELGLTMRKQRDLEGAFIQLSKAVALAPQSPGSLFERGRVLAAQGKFNEAIVDFSAAIDLGADKNTAHAKDGAINRPAVDRVRSDYFAARADALYLTGRSLEAAADYEQASLSPDPAGYNLIWSALARLAAARSDATAELSRAISGGKIKGWPETIARFVVGNASAAETLAAAKDNEQTCEARFYIGALLYAAKFNAKAKSELASARDICPKDFREYTGAVALLKLLDQ